MATFLRKPVPFKEAADWIRNKPAVSREAFDKLLPELKPRAFTITGIKAFDVLEDVRKDIANRLFPDFIDPQADEEMQAKQRQAAIRRAELLIRTQGFQAYQAANHEAMSRNTDALPYWQYLSMEDSRVRPSHAALNGIVLPANSPFWKTHFPPWEWGCRCQVVPLSQTDVEGIQERDADLPEDQRRILSPVSVAKLETENSLARKGNFYNVSSAAQKGTLGAFTFDPQSLRLPLESIRDRYSPSVWASFAEWARKQTLPDGRTVWGWLNP
jgi:SPP1 gp7 family putative phage head morphogenesis protein